MDHYFILIYEDSLSVEDQHLFVQRLNSLLPNEDEVNFVTDFAPHISPILNRNSIYLANINISDLEFVQCSWLEVHGVITHKNIFPASFESNTNCDPHVLGKDSSLSISETIHGLADQLPQSGMYHLDVILSYIILENVDVSNHIDFAGALHRLYIWHHAVFSIICQSILQSDHFQDWSEIINVQILSKQKSSRSAVLWRGSLSLKDEDVSECDQLKGLQLTLNSQKSMHWLTLKDALGVKSEYTPNNSAFILPPYIELLDECCISTIPPYLFSPVHFVLTTIGDDKEDSNTHRFLQYLNSNTEICFILRLRYGLLKKPESSAKSYMTRQWKKAVTTGNINSPVCYLEADSEHAILIAHKHCHLSTALSVYLLNDPSQLNAKIPHDILATNSKYNSQFLKNISEKYSAAIKKLPDFKCREIFFTFLKMLPNCQMEILTDYIRDKAEKSPEEKVELTILEVQTIFNSVQHFLHSQLKFEKGIPFKEKHLQIDSGELDSWDWPERLHLLQKQIKADKAMRHESLAGLMPPQRKTITATATDIGKYFNEFGEPSASRDSESLPIKTKPSYASYQVDDIQEHWPGVLSKKFHDVYYNCNDITEEEEISHAKMKDHLVVHETASTCCNAQFTPSYTVLPLPKKGSRHSPRSLSKASKLKISPAKERKMGERIKSSVGSQNRTLSKERKDLENSQNLLRSRSYSLRRSPRKHPTALPATSNKRKSLERPVTSKQEDLSERHRMKLREAVVIALEKHSIDLNHSMFKPCARKLFAVCKPFVKDIIGKGSTSSQMQRIAAAHAKQVVDFEMQKKA